MTTATMKPGRMTATGVTCVLLSALCLPLAHAEDAASFFKARKMILITSASVGGGYDQYARLLADDRVQSLRDVLVVGFESGLHAGIRVPAKMSCLQVLARAKARYDLQGRRCRPEFRQLVQKSRQLRTHVAQEASKK